MLIRSKFNGYSADGLRRIHFDSGGGGGGGGGQQTVTNTNIPEYAQPYMETVLGKAQALTDTPYQTYGGERIAGQTGLQKQAATSMGGMDAGPAGFAANVGAYMSPYMQNVVDVQKREATRQSDIAGQDQQAKAAQAGAFGGYRDAIQRSERERNLGQQLGDIQARGSQAAFDAASGQFRQGIGQGMDVAKGQNALGSQEQQLEQNRLSQQYQDFLNQQNNPYKQIGFMSDILRGIPGTSAASTIYQAPPNALSQVAGLGTLATGLMKAEGGIIDSTEGYAEGGEIGAPNDAKLRDMLAQLSDAQLQAVAKSGKYDPAVIHQEVQRRAMLRSASQGIAGLPAAQTEFADGGIVAFAEGGVPQEDEYGYLPGEGILDRMKRRAEGLGSTLAQGARWLANPGRVPERGYSDEAARGSRADALRPDTDAGIAAIVPQPVKDAPAQVSVEAAKPSDKTASGPGITSLVRQRTAAKTAATPTAGAKSTPAAPDTDFTPATYEDMGAGVDKLAKSRNEETKKAYEEYRQQLQDERAGLKGKDNVKEALIRAGLGMLTSKNPNALAAIGEGATQGFDAYNQAQKLDQEALKSNQRAEMLLMQAERAERSGNLRDATALYAQARAEKQAATTFGLKKQELSQTADYQQGMLRNQAAQIAATESYRKELLGARNNPAKMDLATLKAQQGNVQAQLKANPTMEFTDPEGYAALVSQMRAINEAIAKHPGGATIPSSAPMDLSGWGKPVLKN